MRSGLAIGVGLTNALLPGERGGTAGESVEGDDLPESPGEHRARAAKWDVRLPNGSPIIRRQVDAAESRGKELFLQVMRREEIDVIGIVSRLRVERVRRSDEEEPGRS